MKKTLLIKVSTIFKPVSGKNRYVSGIGRSTYQILKALSLMDDISFNIRLYGAGISCISRTAQDIPLKYNFFPLPMKIGTKYTNLESFFLNNVYKHDLLHIPHNYDYALRNNQRFVVTIHDTCEYDIAKKQRNEDRIKVWEYAAQQSILINTDSEYSKRDIMDRFNVPEQKITVIPLAVSKELFHQISVTEINSVLRKYGIEKPYFLAVSCSNSRKNIPNLLCAYSKYASLSSDPAILVLIWSNPPQHILIDYRKEIDNGRIKFLDYVSDNDLVALYNGTLATMYPSRYEGFGFPILESFACGAPVMTCRNSSLPEVGGDLAVYVGEDDIDEMVDVMDNFAMSRFDYKRFKEETANYISKFSWENTAKKYVEFYKRSLEILT